MGMKRQQGLQEIRSQELLDLESDWQWEVRERQSKVCLSSLSCHSPEMGAWEEKHICGGGKS